MRLLFSRRFLPLFVAQALGAFLDNLYRNALIVLLLTQAVTHAASLVAFSAALFILPYVIFAAPAGILADRMDKARLLRLTKLGESALTILAVAALLRGGVAAQLAILFGFGVQATFFGPLKYAILPDHLPEAQLLAGNSLIEAGTFLAILLGTLAGSWLAALPGGTSAVGVLAVVAAGCGLLAVWFVPPAPPAPSAAGRMGDGQFLAPWRLLRYARQPRAVWIATLGLSWFWTLGVVLLTQLPVLAVNTLGGDGRVASLFVGGFTLGIGLGSLAAGRLARGVPPARLVLVAGLVMSLALLDAARRGAGLPPGLLTTPAALLAHGAGQALMLDLVVAAAAGGLFSVPLYVLLQIRAAPSERARTVAAGNLVNAGCMAMGSALVAVLPLLGTGAPAVIALAAAGNVAATLALAKVGFAQG